MATEDFKRKLTAILSADVKGYSRLMGEDEEATIRTLKGYRELIAERTEKHRGRIVDSPGDNVLAEFGSVVDAVRCAVEIQEELKVRNTELPENRQMAFRIGVNLGDVIEDEKRLYGDGVNIAARMEGLAEGGGICISGSAYEQVRNKLTLGYEYLGEHTVKNIEQPVKVYRVLMEPEAAGKVIGEERPTPRRWRRAVIAAVVVVILVAGALAIWNFYLRPPFEPASVEKMAFPLPEKPSIAVLPFVNMSGDPEQEYIADGITENIITALSKIPEMFVMARTSTFSYKDKPVKVKQVSEELGVRYVLEGSVQKEGDRVRITAQLIDALKGHHLWAEQYNRDMKGFFGLLDEITKEIGTALQVQLTWGDYARHVASTDNFEAWGYAIKGYDVFRYSTKRNNAKARELFEKAVELDPEYVVAWRMLGYTHYADAWMGWSKSRRQSIERTIELAQKALSIDDSYAGGHALLADAYLLTRQHEKAIKEGQRALALDPNDALGYIVMTKIMHYSGRFEEAIPLIKTGMRLHGPYFPAHYLLWLGLPLHMAGRNDEALPVFKKLLERRFPELYVQVNLAVVNMKLGREEEARKHANEVLRLNPKFSLEWWSKMELFKDPAHLESRLDSMRKAGLPDKPPLPLPDKPSIAVLPFVNMSEDPKQEYFSDGITENIITALSKVEKLFVIARNSTFTYKGKPVKVQQVAQDLGVQYVLEGSVQRSADRIRITAQFVDARKGHHLWAERYDRDLKDLFALQDEITMKIITALEVKLTEGEQALVAGSGTDNLDAYLKILQARDLKRHQNIENNHKARRLAEEAIKLDPDYAQAYRWLSGTHVIDVWLGSTKSPRESLRKAMELAKKALSLDDSLGGAHGLLGNIYIMRKDYEKGIREAERAVELEPNGADAHAFLGMGLRFAGRPEEAIPILKKAIRLDPHAPGWYLHVLAGAYREIEKYEEAIEWGEKAVHQNPKNVLSRVALCSIYSLAGRMDKASAQAKEIMRLNPKFSVERFARTDPQKNQAVKKRYIDALYEAGLK